MVAPIKQTNYVASAHMIGTQRKHDKDECEGQETSVFHVKLRAFGTCVWVPNDSEEESR
jgi:hypothetical protein